MDVVTIGFDPELDRWCILDLDDEEREPFSFANFLKAAETSGLQWEHLDKVQEYLFKVTDQGLRFLGTQARWGDFVPATQDQLVLKRPA